MYIMKKQLTILICQLVIIIGIVPFLVGFRLVAEIKKTDSCKIQHTSSLQTDKGKIEVTYIANSGFLIEVGNKKILIDALFKNGLNYYPAPSAETINAMEKGITPFDNISLALTTHLHPDHCDAQMYTEFLKNNGNAAGVVSSLALKGLKIPENNNTILSRIVSITPNLYSSIDTTVNDINLKVLRLRHSGSDGKEENIGFLIKIDGCSILHMGDFDGFLNDGNNGKTTLEEIKALGLENEKIDLAFLNRGVFWEAGAPGIEIVKQCIKAKNIVLYHFSLMINRVNCQT